MSPDYGEFARLLTLLALEDEIATATCRRPSAFVLPLDALPGVSSAYGVTVLRVPELQPSLLYTPEAS